MLAEWERQQPGRAETMFAALQRVAPSQLADRELFDFTGLEGAAPGSAPGPVAEAPPAGEAPVRWLDGLRSPGT